MQRVITSNNITFMDTSDERKLEVFISSNLPTSQIYNSNTGAYSPDWTVNNLVLEASIFLNSIEKTTNATIQWSKKFGTGDVIATGSGDNITISTNELSDISGIVTYICTAQYDGITATSKMVFTRVDTGINGINGKDGVDGINGTSQYFHVKYSNDGISFTEPNGETSGDWMGTCVTSTADAPTNFDDYEWRKIVGEAGLPGKDGISGKDGTDGKDGVTYYTWIKYADTPTSGMSDDPDGKVYMGLAYNKTTKEESENYSDYIWSRIRGEDGSDGINGVNGKDGKTYYTWVKYADDINGSNMSDDPTGKEYIGLAYNKTTLVESNNASDYQWALFKGADGVDGKDGINGTNGIDGKTTYFHIKYSNVSNPTNDQMTEIPSKYIGTYVDYTETDSPDSSEYTWMKFMGDDGIDGKDGVDGIPGTNGKDGQTYYLHIKYSDDGGNTFTANNGETSGQYIGVYTDIIQTDSMNVSAYTWSLIKGKDGKDGITYYTWIKYADDENGTNMSDDPNGKTYIGIAYNKVEKTESSNYNDYTWSLIKGRDGTDGVNGIDGLDGKTYYTWVKYADDENGVNMSDDPTGKEYIGLAYNKDTPIESNIASDYIWSLFKGSDGIDGKGILSIEEYYAISTSNSIAPDDDKFSTSVSTLTSTNKYLWNYEKITYTDKTNYISKKRVLGVYGDSAIIYSMSVSANVISKNESNQYNPSVIKLEGKQKIGNNLISDYYGRFKIEETTDMSSWTPRYSSSADENIKEYIPSAGIKALKCSMYQAGDSGVLLDHQIIPIVSDGLNAYTVVLSNESYTFAGTELHAISGNITCEVIAYKGTERVAATIGSISGHPTGMETSISNNGTTSANFTVSVDSNMDTKSGMLIIPITVDGRSFTKYFSYSLALKGFNGITFQIYGEQGLVLTSDTPETNLRVFAYDGDKQITTDDAQFQWYYQDNVEVTNEEDGSTIVTTEWIKIDNAVSESYKVEKKDIFKAASYKCEMIYNEKIYCETIVVQDRNDIYSAVINVSDTIKTSEGQCYWVLSASIYSEKGEEVDKLLGPISRTEPGYTWIKYADDENGTNMSDSSTNNDGTNKNYIGIAYNKLSAIESTNASDYKWQPFDGNIVEQEGIPEYYYYIDMNYGLPTVILKHYNGESWENATNGQLYDYMWDIMDDGDSETLKYNKVKVISSDDFTNTINIMCTIGCDDGVQAKTTISLTDTSDPIISQLPPPPSDRKEGQIWIQKNDNNEEYSIWTWTTHLNNDGTGQWVNVNKKSTVHTICPSIYNKGDFWVTDSNDDYYQFTTDENGDYTTEKYCPYLKGTLLIAIKGNESFDFNDWILASAKEDYTETTNYVDSLGNFVEINADGITIKGKYEDGRDSNYWSNFKSDKLSFNYKTEEKLVITTEGIETPQTKVEDGLTVTNGPITLGSLVIQKETNESYSFII